MEGQETASAPDRLEGKVRSLGFVLVGVAIAVTAASYLLRGQRIDVILVPMIVLGLLPHCVCQAPVNVLWQGVFGGYSPTCNMVPLAVTLFSVAALRGVQPRYSTILSAVCLAMVVFMAVGNPLIGLPWAGCI